MDGVKIVPLGQLDFRLVDWKWPFATNRHAEISAHFDELKRKNDALWNGRVFLLRGYEISGRLMRGDFFETDFASLMAWRDWGFPDRTVHACFAMAAVEGTDRGFLLGIMGDHTANPGVAYFPTGTPDHSDLDGEAVDFDASVNRELKEETGFSVNRFRAEAGWQAVFTGQQIAVIKRLYALETAEELRERARAFLARETQPEFSDICVLHGPDDLGLTMPRYVRYFLERAWGEKA